jgi:hypothetical protein
MTPTADLQKLLAVDTRRIFERLGGVEAPMMEGDNLSVLLASYFEDPDDETDDETGWGETALKGMEEVLEAIGAHFKPLAARVLELEAENKRLREGLRPFVEATINADIDRMENNDCLFDVTWPSRRGFTNRSILTIQNVRQARTALKGGEI